MKKINLLKSLPKSKRSVENRKSLKTQRHINISRQYGKMYFDGPRSYGYGGYGYDGRWIPVAKDIIKYFRLKKGSKILDIGCAKGFLVKDLLNLGIDSYGIDISRYALDNSDKELAGRLHLGSADDLPFTDNSFDAVFSINTIHNLNKKGCIKAIKEIERVSKGKSFIQVDAYGNLEQKKIFMSWVLTAKFHTYTYEWEKIFKKAGYTGCYNWTII